MYKDKAAFSKEFKEGRFGKPGNDFNRDAEGFLRWARFVYGKYASNMYAIGFGGKLRNQRTIAELRNYARGLQDASKYISLLEEDDHEGKGYMNIGWDNVQILPKFRDIILGKLDAVKFGVGTNVMDELGKADKAKLINNIKWHLDPRTRALQEMTGAHVPDNEQIPGVGSIEEVDLMDEIGSIQTGVEVMMKDAIDATLYVSNFEELKSMWGEDLVDLNIAIGKLYVEKSDNIVKCKYIDPAKCFYQHSIHSDKRDISVAGHFENWNIAKLRECTDLEERDLYKIAKSYKGFGDNANRVRSTSFTDRTTREEYYKAHGEHMYDQFRVDVMEFNFIASEAEKYVVGYHHSSKVRIFDRVDMDSTLDRRDKKRGKEMKVYNRQKVYKCKWIVGTKYVFDYGLEYAGVTEGQAEKKVGTIPYIIVEGNGPSIIERCIPHVDDLQLAVLQKRNALSKFIPGPRMVWDASKIDPFVSIGGKKYDFFKMVKIFGKEGHFIYQGNPDYEDRHPGSISKPFEFVPNPIAEDLRMFIELTNDHINDIRNVTGINEIADGSNQNPDLLKGVMDGMNAATNNALRPFFSLFKRHKARLVQQVGYKWKMSIRAGDINLNYIPYGQQVLKNVTLDKELLKYELGVFLDLLPSDEEKQVMMALLQQKHQEQQITIDAFFKIQNMIRQGDLRKAEIFMAKAVKEYQNYQQQVASQNIQEQAQANAEAAKATEDAKAATEQNKSQSRIREMHEKAGIDAKQAQVNHGYAKELEEIRERARLRAPKSND